MTTPFRQLIRPGQSGRDVTAVKRTMKRMGIKGAKTLSDSNVAGPAFVDVLDTVLRQHGLKQDHIYGKGAHAIIAPHFRAYEVFLYKTAKIRPEPAPPIPHGTAQEMARRLLVLHNQGKYHADNPGDLYDIQRTADGRAVWSRGGYWVNMDPRPLRLLVWLIDTLGYKIGTFALCSDHHWDGPHGHSGGLAVDISSINGKSLSGGGTYSLTLAVAKQIAYHSEDLKPWQLICDGAGYVHYSDIQACCIPYASLYGYTTLSQHRNHIHAGYYR